jgi:hypothetical protein
MLKASFCLQDDTMPRTVYWESFIKALNTSGLLGNSDADLLIPLEDTAMETNWPRYGNPKSTYIRGNPHDLSKNGSFCAYFDKVMRSAANNPNQKLLYINMHPFFRAPLLFRKLRNVVVADVSLAMFERDLNSNTISMPALPIVFSRSYLARGERPILASFQGRIDTHPVRRRLKTLADEKGATFFSLPWRRPKAPDGKGEKRFVVKDVGINRHIGKVDAVNSKTDPEYENLFLESTFALVPRGDALFSYRLLEAMSFGCIPIIISDGWILPFDRTIPWEQFSLRIHADAITDLPNILADLSEDDILSRQEKVIAVYSLRLASLDLIIAALIREVEALLKGT